MAGRPWEERLCLHLQASNSFVLLVTKELALSFDAATCATRVDILLVEIILALAFYSKGQLGVLLPLLIGRAKPRADGGEEAYGA